MALNYSLGWWTDEKVEATVTSQYVHSHLTPNEAEQLTKSVFGDLSDDTYLEWILTRAKRFFLTLVESGVPDQIFGVIDDSWDDEDLPIPADEVGDLLLSAEPDAALDRCFYKAQFKYVIRVVGDGEHIRYAEEETVPVNSVNFKPVIARLRNGMDKVKLPSSSNRIFTRKRIALTDCQVEDEVLAEIAEWRSFAHPHVLSIFGSYTTQDEIHVLMTPSSDITLRSFLNDTPKTFEALPKADKRQKVLQWSHCLAFGVAWLHKNTKHHGAIRPSRVYIDEHLNICLGPFDGSGLLCDDTIKDDIEAYQYAAPERWKRSVTIQSTGNGRVALPSGGRTVRRLTMDPERATSPEAREDTSSSSGSHRVNTMRPTSVSYAFSPTSRTGTRLRLGFNKNMSDPSDDARPNKLRQSDQVANKVRPARTSLESHVRPGAISALSSSSNEAIRARRQPGPIFAATPEMRTAVIQTWTSAQHDQLAADIFSLGAVMLEILTFLCKQSSSSFARHRASKNRSGGRGGGLADASFHANIGQVVSWIHILQKDAEKRVKKDEGTIYRAVAPSLQVVLQCIEREPSDRLSADEAEQKLLDCMRDFAGLYLPSCCSQAENDQIMGSKGSKDPAMDLARQTSAILKLKRKESRGRSQILPGGSDASGPLKLEPRSEALKLSPSYLDNLISNEKGNTESAVGSGVPTKMSQQGLAAPTAQARPDSFAFNTGDAVEVFPRPPTANSKQKQPIFDGQDEATTVSGDTSIAEAAMMGLSVPASYAGSLHGHSEVCRSSNGYTSPTIPQSIRDLPPLPRSSVSRNAALTSNPYPAQATSKLTNAASVLSNSSTLSPLSPVSDKQSVARPPRTTSTQAKIQDPYRYTQARPETPTVNDEGEGENYHQISPMSTPRGSTRSPVSSPEAPLRRSFTAGKRHYRTRSRAGSKEGRAYAGKINWDPITLKEE